MKTFSTTLFILSLIGAIQSRGESLPIVNPGFESQHLGDDQYTDNAITGWTGSRKERGSFGAYNPPITFFVNQAPEGLNVAFIQVGAIHQTLTATLAPKMRYTLSVAVGRSLVDTLPSYAIQLRAGSNILSTATNPIPIRGTFQIVTTEYATTDSNPMIGVPLEIWLIDTDPSDDFVSEPYFDNIRLAANPVDAANLQIRSSEVEISWLSLSNREYRVQYRPEVADSEWVNLFPSDTPGNGGLVFVFDRVPLGTTRRLYRVLTLP